MILTFPIVFSINASDIALEENLKQFLLVLLVALSVATLPKIFSWFRQIPYTLLLVIVGLGLASVEVRLIDLSPGLILFIFLPPLLFEAAWNTKWSELRKELLPVGLYAVGGVVISILGVAWALHQLVGVPLMTALLVGACLSATDSASVIGLFRELGAGKRLTTLMEGESLFNDGASVVAFGLLVELATGSGEIDVSSTVVRFFMVVGIGIGLGGLIGVCISLLTQRYELAWVEQSLTLVTAYGTYLLVEELGGSGVIGVVTAGLVLGNFSVQMGLEPVKRGVVSEFWEFLVFFVNSIVFLLLGDQIHFPRLIDNLPTTLVAITAVIGSRAISIYGLGALSNRFAKTPIPLPEQTVLWWAGLRGSVSIALALSIPLMVAGREEIIANVFGGVLFTLLVQGLTTKFLLERFNLLEDRSLLEEYLELIARRDALKQVLEHLIETEDQPAIDVVIHQSQIDCINNQLPQFQLQIDQMREHHPQLKDFVTQQHQEKLLAIESDTYTNFVRAGLLRNQPPSIVQKVLDEGN